MDPGEYRNIFRRFFGYNPNFGQGKFPFEDHPEDEGQGGENEHFPCLRSQDDFTNSRGFSVYSDPLEINRFFEHQMDEMLKIFGGFGFEGFPNQPHNHNSLERFDDFKFEESEPEIRNPDGYARDFMLKEKDNNGHQRQRVDTEVEWDKLDMDELDKLMSKQETENHDRTKGGRVSIFDLMPRHHFESGPSNHSYSPNHFSFSFGSSMSEKTIRNPNGGIETVRTVRNSDGSETITSRKQLGDKTYEMVTIRDKSGQSSSEEKLINISESELHQFKESFGNQIINQSPSVPSYEPRNEMMQGPLQDSSFYRMWDKFFGK